MHKTYYDIVVSGAGPAGLLGACAFGAQGKSVLLVDPIAPVTKKSDPKADLRTTAFLQPAIDLMREINIWDKLHAYATPIEIMRLADAGGVANEIRHVADFNALDIGAAPFGYNLQNTRLKDVLLRHLENTHNVSCQFGHSLQLRSARTTGVICSFGDMHIQAKALILAEGRNSENRDRLSIQVTRKEYAQTALVFSVSHTLPHKNISTEIHRTGGPFTLVPMRDWKGAHCSSVVWMEKNKEAKALVAMSKAEFTRAVQDRSANVLGALKPITTPQSFPIIHQLADKIGTSNCYLIAETAHVVPPIGAQGLNISLADIKWLYDNADAISKSDQTDAYHNARHGDMKLRLRGIDALNHAAMTDRQVLRDLRLQGLKALSGISPIRDGLMRKGLGV